MIIFFLENDNCKVNGWQTVCKSKDPNAICTDKVKGYNCTCSDDYTGKDCETSIIVWKVIQDLGGGEEDIINLLEEVVQSPGLIKDIMPFILGQQSLANQSAMSWDYEDLFVWAAYEETELDIKYFLELDIYKWYDITLGN
uniref:EGF-like domain-containing protein n=1 Tax=Panagrolaimus superbus TaxID=310955 RepID=A0A914Z9S1_9BILA